MAAGAPDKPAARSVRIVVEMCACPGRGTIAPVVRCSLGSNPCGAGELSEMPQPIGGAHCTPAKGGQPASVFEFLVKGVTDYAIYMLDPEGRITTWNAGAERLKG